MGENNRNLPCWCGSGKKYKKCHLNRENEERIKRSDLEKHNKNLSLKRECCVKNLFGNECTTTIVKAHSISKSGSLKEISVNSHIMGTKPHINTIIKNDGKIFLEEVGINKASTFTGFCSKHDKELFAEIEDKEITLSDKQLFLLAYRGMCREIFLKEQNKETEEFLRNADRGKDIFTQQAVQTTASSYGFGVDLALRDMKHLKQEMDSILCSSDFSKVNHCVIEFDSVPSVQVSAMIAPELDFDDNALQDLGDPDIALNYLIFNCISYKGKGCFVFSWLVEQNEYCEQFIDSLLKMGNEQISDALVRFCYSFSENTWASPTWWKSLGEAEKNSISDRLLHGASPEHLGKTTLKDDGYRFNAYSISKRELRIATKT